MLVLRRVHEVETFEYSVVDLWYWAEIYRVHTLESNSELLQSVMQHSIKNRIAPRL